MLSLELEQLQENPSEVQSGARTPKSDRPELPNDMQNGNIWLSWQASRVGVRNLLSGRK
jgi:hypothetical protein